MAAFHTIMTVAAGVLWMAHSLFTSGSSAFPEWLGAGLFLLLARSAWAERRGGRRA